jgi:CRP-like cAMP-binding protein
MPNLISPPAASGEFKPGNRLLAALSAKELQSLQPHLEAVTLARGSILFDVDDPLTCVYFIQTGVASLAAMENRVPVGVATVGREGAAGLDTLLMGGDSALGRFQVLIPGSALTMKAWFLRTILRESANLRVACEAYAQTIFVQMLQAVPCNRLHTVEQRCARWLLMCRDHTEGHTFELTHECLAEMLGMTQSSLTPIVRELEHAGVIRYRNSAITVLDYRALEAVACECYCIVRHHRAACTAAAAGNARTWRAPCLCRLSRVGQLSDTQPIDLNSNPVGIGRHVSGIADWIATTWNNMSNPGEFAAARAEEQEGDPPPLAGAGVVVCLMGWARAFGAAHVWADSSPDSQFGDVPGRRSSAHPVPPSTVGRPSAQPLGCRDRW